MLGSLKPYDSSSGSVLPGWGGGGREALGGAGGLGGEAATLEPQAAIPPAGTDVVAEDARRLRPGILGVEGHVGVRGRAAVGERSGRRGRRGRRGQRTAGAGARRGPRQQRAPRDRRERCPRADCRPGTGGLRRAHARRRRRRRRPGRGEGPQAFGAHRPRGGALASGRVDDVARQERLKLAAGRPHLGLRSQRGYRALTPRGGHGRWRRRRRQRRRAAHAPAAQLPRPRAHPAVQAAGGPGRARGPGRGCGQGLAAVLGRKQRGRGRALVLRFSVHRFRKGSGLFVHCIEPGQPASKLR